MYQDAGSVSTVKFDSNSGVLQICANHVRCRDDCSMTLDTEKFFFSILEVEDHGGSDCTNHSNVLWAIYPTISDC